MCPIYHFFFRDSSRSVISRSYFRLRLMHPTHKQQREKDKQKWQINWVDFVFTSCVLLVTSCRLFIHFIQRIQLRLKMFCSVIKLRNCEIFENFLLWNFQFIFFENSILMNYTQKTLNSSVLITTAMAMRTVVWSIKWLLCFDFRYKYSKT